MSKTIHWLRRCALPVLLMTAACATASAQDAPAAPLPAPPATMDALPAGSTPPPVGMDTTSTTSTTSTTTTTGMDMGSMDYSLLSNPAYDYVDLKRAQRVGYSDSQVASISKISRLSGLPFSFVLSRVQSGRTFALLASDYNLRLGDVLDVADEQARIARYLSLYESLNQLGTVHTADVSTAQTISGPTLAELEARYNQLNAAFPALPPTNIETSQIGSGETTTTTVAQAPPPPPPPAPEAPPVPEAPPPAVIHTETIVTRTYHARRHRHHAVRHRVIRHRHQHRVRHVTRMGS